MADGDGVLAIPNAMVDATLTPREQMAEREQSLVDTAAAGTPMVDQLDLRPQS